MGDPISAYFPWVGKENLSRLTTEECKQLAREILESRNPGISKFLVRLEAANAGAVAILRGLATGATESVMPFIVMPQEILDQLAHPYCPSFTSSGGED